MAGNTLAFDLVINLLTRFGYFSSDDENRVVLSEVSRVLGRNGIFVLGCLNSDTEFVLDHERGDYSGPPLEATSPRAILFAHRS